jgi:pimeloyl-ACP methyl ester carboxylesterase
VSILLIHGVGGRPRSWDMVLGHLDPGLRRQAHAVDVTVSAGQSVAAVARVIMAKHPGSHVLVGHSFGGMIAQEIALTDPTRVRALVLVSTIPGATERVAGINRVLADAIEERGLDAVAEGFGAGLFAPGRLTGSPWLGTSFVADMLDAGATSVCAALRAIAEWDAANRLPRLRCPATVLAGDAEVDLDRQALLAKLLGGSLQVLGDTGHLAPLEAPAEVARAITELTTAVTLADGSRRSPFSASEEPLAVE